MSRTAEFAWGKGDRPLPIDPGHAEVIDAIPGDDVRDDTTDWRQTRQERWMPHPVTLSRGWAD